MKKILCVVLSVVFLFCFCSCTDSSDEIAKRQVDRAKENIEKIDEVQKQSEEIQELIDQLNNERN